jgi:glycosyltransferase involved in cell wall biosynthesis
MAGPVNTRPSRAESLISAVLPVYNEVEVLPRLRQLVDDSLEAASERREIVFVNDGSRDGSGELLDRLALAHEGTRVVHLSRNFGHQAAVQAGLQAARGDAVIVMDSDLQDDPAALPRMVDAWRAGADVVYAVRHGRKEAAWKRFLFESFYRVLNSLTATPFPRDAGNFGLLDRRVATLVAELPECDRYFAGLRGWVGFRQEGIPVERLARYDAQPRVSLLGLFRLAKTAIFSFSRAPLTAFYLFGVVSLLVCAAFTLFSLYHKLFTGLAVPGWTSGVVIASLFGALNALGIGILGEYIVRIYDQVRGRPRFIVARETGQQTSPATTDALPEDIAELLEFARRTREFAQGNAATKERPVEMTHGAN